MAPRIIRPEHDRANWIVAAVCAAAALVLGYFGATRVFKPAAVEPSGESTEEEATASEPAADAGHDAGAAATAVAPTAPSDAGTAAEPEPPAETTPAVPVRVAHMIVQSCGDGEELTMPGASCAPVPGLDEAMRHRLLDLGNCPTAMAAAASPESVLSIGLRIDFPRHRVTALPGHSSSVRSPLTFVPCARAAFANAPELWRLTPPHPRYLYFYSVHFGPVSAAAHTPATPSSPTTATPGTSPNEPATAPTAGVPSSGDASVVWTHAIVRDAPRTGAVVARLPQGTHVTVLSRQSQWWQVRWASGSGWVYGEAIGR